jgi:putative ABC transport system permease protein
MMGGGHFFRRAKRLADNRQELQFHIDAETEDNIARGMLPEAARTAARRRLGNVTLIREEVYTMHSVAFVETTWSEVRHSLRAMRKNLAFTLTAILTLAIGIGGNTAIFSMIRAVLLKPLPYRAPDCLVYLTVDHPRKNQFDMQFQLTRLEQMRKAQSFAAVGAFGANVENMTLSGQGQPEALKGARVSANVLEILGVRPIVGRSFLPEEDALNGPPVVMISASLWKRRFNGETSAIGGVATLDARSYTIVGVLPPGFEFPFSGLDLWFPKPSQWSALPSRYWDLSLVQGFGRLKPHVSLDQARAEIRVLDRQYVREYHGLDPGEMRVMSLKDRLVQNVRLMLWMLFGAVGFVLLIACANVVGLLLARSTTRSREFAVRMAIGAARIRLIRQLLVESIVVALSGGVVGVLLAEAALRVMKSAAIFNLYSPNALYLPGATEIRLDGVVLAFTVALCFLSGILFGLFPSLQLSRPDLGNELRETGAAAGRIGSAYRGRFRIDTRGILVVGQIALSIVLLIGAALLMRSVARLESVHPGLDPAHLLTMKISLPPTPYDRDQKKVAFFRDLAERAAAVPAVQDATVAMSLPTTVWIRTNITQIEGAPAPDANDPLLAVIQSVTPGYFRTLRIPLRRGREFTARDNSTGALPVAIVNETLARRLWQEYPKGPNPVGRDF